MPDLGALKIAIGEKQWEEIRKWKPVCSSVEAKDMQGAYAQIV